ncbi:MAG: hypothetical protein ACJ72W_00075 [Actinoallomurus sp.]
MVKPEVALPEGWELSTDDAGQPTLRRVYEAGAWRTTVIVDVAAPFTGPSSVHIDYTGADAAESEGVTLEILRAVPLGEVRKVLREHLPRIRASLAPETAVKLPTRCETPYEYALVAEAYVRLVNAGEQRPVQVMATSAGISRNTISARVRRARNMDLIKQTGTGTGHLSAQLTKAAEKLLEVGDRMK